MNALFHSVVAHSRRIERLVTAILIFAAGAGIPYLSSGQEDPGIRHIRFLEALVYDGVNAERAKHGLPELAWASDVSEVARRHSEDMGIREYFSHADLEGELVGTRLEKAGIAFDVSSENLFKGVNISDVANESVMLWMQSPEHRKNLLGSDFTETGIGVYKAAEENEYYVTQIFIKRALTIVHPPSRLTDEEIDTVFDIVKKTIGKSRFDYDSEVVKGRILEGLSHAGIPYEENSHIEGFLKDIPVLDLTVDVIARKGFIIKFTDGDPDKDLKIFRRLVHHRGYSAVVLIHEADGKVLFPLIRINESEPERKSLTVANPG